MFIKASKIIFILLLITALSSTSTQAIAEALANQITTPETSDAAQARLISPVPPTLKNKKTKITIPSNTLWYTVQLGSFTTREDAITHFDDIADQLPVRYHQYLRIEKIGSIYTVRAGKATSSRALQPLLDTAKQLVTQPLQMKAYFKTERIIKTAAVSTEETLSNDSKPQDPTPTDTKQQTTLSPQISTTLANKATKNEEPARPPLPKKMGPTPGSKEYLETVMAKFLGAQNTGEPERDEKTRQHLAKFTASPNCLTADCHSKLAEEKNTHMPVKSAKCLACHQQVQEVHPAESGSSFSLVAEGGELCSICHQFSKQGSTVHSPFEEGECLQCHNPHGSQFPALAKVGQTDQQDLCFACHDKALINKKMLHGPVGLGVCTYCHNPHDSDEKALLRQPPQALCHSCHSEVAEGIEQANFVHPVVKEQGCQSCHAAHGSDYPNLLPDIGMDFCYTCHTDIANIERKARVKHDGLYLENKQCATCHLAHFSEYDSLLPMEPKKLCLTCHGNESTLESYSPKNIEQELNDKEYLHTPVAEGNCTGCHAPHGSNYNAILIGQYPTSFYAPYTRERYALCFSCHEEEILAPGSTTTSFRNGEVNLHLTHVGIPRKGRTCQACHTPHASNGPKLINRTGASFGSWTMSINFTIGESGGRCIPGCHREMEYDRITPVNNNVEEKDYGKSFIDYENNNL